MDFQNALGWPWLETGSWTRSPAFNPTSGCNMCLTQYIMQRHMILVTWQKEEEPKSPNRPVFKRNPLHHWVTLPCHPDTLLSTHENHQEEHHTCILAISTSKVWPKNDTRIGVCDAEGGALWYTWGIHHHVVKTTELDALWSDPAWLFLHSYLHLLRKILCSSLETDNFYLRSFLTAVQQWLPALVTTCLIAKHFEWQVCENEINVIKVWVMKATQYWKKNANHS